MDVCGHTSKDLVQELHIHRRNLLELTRHATSSGLMCNAVLSGSNVFSFVLSWMFSSFINENGWEWLLYKFVILLTNIDIFAKTQKKL